jgi:hypothetical protein
MLFGLGRINGLRWRLLPSAGDWAYRDEYGRLSSFDRFLECRRGHHQSSRRSQRATEPARATASQARATASQAGEEHQYCDGWPRLTPPTGALVIDGEPFDQDPNVND